MLCYSIADVRYLNWDKGPNNYMSLLVVKNSVYFYNMNTKGRLTKNSKTLYTLLLSLASSNVSQLVVIRCLLLYVSSNRSIILSGYENNYYHINNTSCSRVTQSALCFQALTTYHLHPTVLLRLPLPYTRQFCNDVLHACAANSAEKCLWKR